MVHVVLTVFGLLKKILPCKFKKIIVFILKNHVRYIETTDLILVIQFYTAGLGLTHSKSSEFLSSWVCPPSFFAESE